MPTRIIQCTYCGLNGEIEISDLAAGVSEARLFKFLGHNPFSGHMHYQCPDCGIILLVDPMHVLGEKPLRGVYPPTPQSRHPNPRFGRGHFLGFHLGKGH